ncbi:MBOAT family protein [Desulfovibrio ferrophilus]|uniref:MBOAT family protein n=1 Tax=Desulfovibrio ferrophilus TaxID=241368 RepID=A0A2Z6AVH2_9BACT|nr:MBOAT family protein [Desulfovibrio ferrophilus]
MGLGKRPILNRVAGATSILACGLQQFAMIRTMHVMAGRTAVLVQRLVTHSALKLFTVMAGKTLALFTHESRTSRDMGIVA